MKRHILFRKILGSIALLFAILTINFFITRLMPGDIMVHILGEENYTYLQENHPEKIEETRTKYGFDKPIGIQYLHYIKYTLALDFGFSYATKQPVVRYVFYHLKWTLLLVASTIFLSALIGGFLGILAGWKSESLFDKIVTPVFTFINTLPANCVSIIFLFVFAFQLGWFPISGMTSGGLSGFARWMDILWHMCLPLVILTLFRTGSNFINIKSYTLQIRSEEYILTALSKGLPDWRVLGIHALKNILLPYTTLICMQLGHMIAGSMVVEVVFSWQGMGTLIYRAANAKDFPALQFSLLLISACVIFFNLLADVLYRVIDPRMRGNEAYE